MRSRYELLANTSGKTMIRSLDELVREKRAIENRRANCLNARKVDEDTLDYLDFLLFEIEHELSIYEAAESAEEDDDPAIQLVEALQEGRAEMLPIYYH